jgi:hypothetical protein
MRLKWPTTQTRDIQQEEGIDTKDTPALKLTQAFLALRQGNVLVGILVNT